MSYWSDFLYVDAHYEHPTSKRRMPWKRIPERDVQRLIIGPSRGSNCFTSIQRFKDATSLREVLKETAALKEKGPKNDIEEARLARLIRLAGAFVISRFLETALWPACHSSNNARPALSASFTPARSMDETELSPWNNFPLSL